MRLGSGPPEKAAHAHRGESVVRGSPMTSAAAASAAAVASSRRVAIVSCAASSLIRMLGLPAINEANIENPTQVNCLPPRLTGHAAGRLRDLLKPATKASRVCHLKVLSN